MDTVVIDERALLGALPVSTRKEVAKQVLPYYVRLVALQGDDAAARAGAAKTLLYRARLRHALGTTEEDAERRQGLPPGRAALRRSGPDAR